MFKLGHCERALNERVKEGDIDGNEPRFKLIRVRLYGKLRFIEND